jgi:DNA-binding LacI/PurR family transcriptional regulator
MNRDAVPVELRARTSSVMSSRHRRRLVRRYAWRGGQQFPGRLRQLRSDWTPRAGFEAAARQAEYSNVTAIFAANDPFALGAMKFFDEQNIAVPGRVSVVGFDNVAEANHYNPSLTTVLLDFEEVGYRAVDQILSMMRGEETHVVPLIKPQLILRDSTGPAPA